MPKQNIQNLLTPQWVQSYPLAEDYGANDLDYGENIGDITGFACIVNDARRMGGNYSEPERA